MENNQLINCTSKKDYELNAFERLADKLKSYFPRLKMILLMDALYANQAVMGILLNNHWEYLIKFSKNKSKHFAKLLNRKRNERRMIPDRPYYRGRRQEFYWVNHIEYGYDWELRINLVACLERREASIIRSFFINYSISWYLNRPYVEEEAIEDDFCSYLNF